MGVAASLYGLPQNHRTTERSKRMDMLDWTMGVAEGGAGGKKATLGMAIHLLPSSETFTQNRVRQSTVIVGRHTSWAWVH